MTVASLRLKFVCASPFKVTAVICNRSELSSIGLKEIVLDSFEVGHTSVKRCGFILK